MESLPIDPSLVLVDDWSSSLLNNTDTPAATNNLVFIDPTVESYQSLSADIEAAEVILLDPTQDGVEQITEVLAEHSNLSSVQIVAHGTAANLYLGSAQLNLETLDDYTSNLKGWSEALAPTADILFYGCNVAAEDAGTTFVQQLSQLTGADIAASDDLTGNANLGGDWELETSIGSIESALALSTEAMQEYSAVLDVRVEAESMDLSTYRVRANNSASGGEVISLEGGPWYLFETGTAAFDFSGASGTYDVVVGYYDENDGVSQFQVTQGDTVVDSWAADQDLGSFFADATSLTTRKIAEELLINQGDTFTLTGTENWFEYARVDYIDFIEVTPEPSTFALADNAYSVNEGDGEINVTIARSGGLNNTVSLDYDTVDDTATAGTDYTDTSGTLIFEPGETSQDITIPILDDTASEGNEIFNFVIDNVEGNGTLGAPRTARITIVDDEAPVDAVLLSQTDGSTEVTEGGASDRYSLVLSSQPTANVTINLTGDSQVTTDKSTLTFTQANWDIAQDVTVTALDDAVEEGDHSGTISHSVSSAAPLFDGFDLRDVNVSVLDDDIGTFTLETFVAGLSQPTAFDWSSDGDQMFIAQKNGVVRVADDGSLLSTPFIDISDQVNNTRDRGLLGLAVHPEFESNPYVYLAFTYDPPEVNQNTGLAGPDGKGNRPSRVIRVTADASTDYTTAVSGSEVVLLGTNSIWENISRPDGNSTDNLDIPPSGITPSGENIRDYLATDSESHSIGAVRFGSDGSLFVSNGDGTSYNAVDPRTVRVQDLDNLSGKLLRIDPITGEGLDDNPFYNGDPDSNQSKVYSYGLRNPFRFTVSPDNEPFIGDVGLTNWEEINTGRGANFGWPYYEGGDGESIQRGGYSDLPEAQEFYASGESVEPAIYARSHADGAVAIIMGDFYTGETFPDFYDGALFFSDFGDNTVRYLTFDGGDVEVNTFSSQVQGIVQMSTGPDSNLYYASLQSGEVGRWRFDSSDSDSPTSSALSVSSLDTTSLTDTRDEALQTPSQDSEVLIERNLPPEGIVAED